MMKVLTPEEDPFSKFSARNIGGTATLMEQERIAEERLDDPAFSDVLGAAFRIDNPIISLVRSRSKNFNTTPYDPNYYPSEDLGEYKDTEFASQLLLARNRKHMVALKQDLKAELKDREILERGSGEFVARMVASTLSPEILFAPSLIVKGAKGVSLGKSALKGAAVGGGAIGAAEAALQATQVARPIEETGFAVAGGLILGGILGGGAASLTKKEFDVLSDKLAEDLSRSVGAMEIPKLSIEDLTLKGTAVQKVSKSSRFINVFNRAINSPFQATRDTFVRVAEIPLKIKLNEKGDGLTAAETELKLYEKGLGEAIVSIKDNYKNLKTREKSSGLPPMTQKQFRERVSYAMRNNDTDIDGIDEISAAARDIRRSVIEPLKKEAIALRLLPEDVESRFADSYLTRIWDKDKLLADREGAIKMFKKATAEQVRVFVDSTNVQIARLRKKISKGGEEVKIQKLRDKLIDLEQSLFAIKNIGREGYDDYIEEMAGDMYSAFTSYGPKSSIGFISPVTRGPMKNKVIPIPDNVAAPYLQNDILEIAGSFTRQVGSEVALHRAVGSSDFKEIFSKINKEAEEAIAAAGDNKKLIKQLVKARDNDIKDLEAVRDLLRGTFKRSDDPDSILSQTGIIVKDLQYMTNMGGVLISSFSDIFRNVMINGVKRAFGDLFSLITIPKDVRKAALADLKDAGFFLEAVMNTRVATLADIADPTARRTTATALSGSASQMFSKVTLINNWNDINKAWSGLVTQNRILNTVHDMASGKLQGKDMEYLAYLGINQNMAKQISQQVKKYGGGKGRTKVSGLANWDNSTAARIYKAALRKEADTVIVTKGVSEIPIIANKISGSLIFQFQSFLMSAHQRVMMRGMQDANAAALMGVMSMLAGGMMVAAIKQLEREKSAELKGSKVSGAKLADWDTGKWVIEGLDRSGLIPVFMHANNLFEKSGGYGLGQALGGAPTSRFTGRHLFETLAGPTAGTVNNFGVAIGVLNSPFTGRETSDSDVQDMRRNIPFQNVTGLRFLFDKVQGEVNK